jgi:hypothetical protein
VASRKTKRAEKLAAHFRALKAKRQLANVRKKFKPRKKEHDSFVFLDTRGVRRDVASRAKGFLFYVDKRGRKTFQPAGKAKFSQPQRFRDYDLTRSKHKKAATKWQNKWGFKTFGHPSTVKGRSVGMGQLGRKLRERLGNFIGKFGTSNVMVVEITVHTNRKIVRTQFLLTGSELKAFERGKKKFLQRLAWKAISTELSLEDMVAQTSADFIASLSSNKKKRKGKWTDSRGEHWGKSKYTKVKISQIDFRIKVASKKRLK